VKTAIQVLKLKFLACSLTLHKQNIEHAWQRENTFLEAFRSIPGF